MSASELEETSQSDTTIAFSRFNDDTSYDVILQSSDSIHFRAHRLILNRLSLVFKDILKMPHTATNWNGVDTIDGRPVVALTEDSHVLELLLRFSYPDYPNPTGLTGQEWYNVLEVARKYQADGLKITLESLLLLQSGTIHPVELYAISCSFNWKEGCKKATEELLKTSQYDWPQSDVLKNISAWKYVHLQQYYTACCIAAHDCTKSERVHTSLHSLRSCACCTEFPDSGMSAYGVNEPAQWFSRYLDDARRALMQCPSASAVTDPTFMAPYIRMAFRCQVCKQRTDSVVSDSLLRLRQKIVEHVDKAVKAVNFDLDAVI